MQIAKDNLTEVDDGRKIAFYILFGVLIISVFPYYSLVTALSFNFDRLLSISNQFF